MRTLITGINGFVGGHLAEYLIANHPWQVAGVARQDTLALPQLHGHVTLFSADISDPQQLRAVLEAWQPELIFHLAGQANVQRSFQDPAGTLQTNIFVQLTLFETLRSMGLNPLIIIACSNEMYGHVTLEELPLTEQTPLRPVSPYAVSKATQDLLAYQYFVSHQIRTIRMRPFNHIGPRQTEQYVASAFAAQIARIEAGQQPPLLRVGNLSAERDFTDVRDMVRAYAFATQYATPGAAYNVGSGQSVSVRWLLDTLISHSHAAIEVEIDPARMRPADIPIVSADASRFRQQTGWEPRIPLSQTLHDILAYWRTAIQ
jgi:GDP-4-dehydro-6-deoxy-D-mannose reductase